MQKLPIILFVLCATLIFSGTSFSQTEEPNVNVKEPDSSYIEREQEQRNDGGGLLDFLPFFGNRSEKLPKERLAPSPRPGESKPVLSENDLNELKMVAGHWLLTSEITEPTVRKNPDGYYYRDYIVFAEEYRIEVLRGAAPDKPFIAHVFVQGDYFHTAAYKTSEEAKSDYNFKFEPLEFRVVFERVEKWDYSYSSDEAPIIFREQWVFRKLQSKAKLDEATVSPVVPAAAAAPVKPAEGVKPEGALQPEEALVPPSE